MPWYRQAQTVTYNYCDICPWRCGLVVTSVNGRVVKIDGNPKDPKSRGRLCARGQAGVSFVYDPDRLKQPLIRTGAHGAGQFRRATWDEALGYSAEKMLALKDTYGPESIAFFGHTSGDFWFVDYLPQAWGSPNAAKPSTSLCTSPREEAALLTIGRMLGNHEPLAGAGFDPLPVYQPIEEPPAGYFRLLYGRSPVHTFARTQNTPLLHALLPENSVWINTAAAARLGLNDGDRVWLENQDGVRSGPIRVKATPRMRADCVFVVHGLGHEAPGMTRANGQGASDVRLQTRYALDPISGGAGLRINFVTLIRDG